MKIDAGQFRMLGRSRGKERITVLAGEGVHPGFVAYMRAQFLAPRYSFEHALNPQLPPEMSLVEDLASRGYDLATLRFSIFLKDQGPARTRAQVPYQRPGVLSARWGWVDYDHTPDIVCGWMRPCRKGDCNLLLGALSLPSMSLADRLRRRRGESVLKVMERYGFDLRTFRFEVRLPGLHAADLAGPR